MNDELTPEETALVRAVSDRINAARKPEGLIEVTSAEEEACHKAVVINLRQRGLDPIPYCDSLGLLLFRNFSLKPRFQ